MVNFVKIKTNTALILCQNCNGNTTTVTVLFNDDGNLPSWGRTTWGLGWGQLFIKPYFHAILLTFKKNFWNSVILFSPLFSSGIADWHPSCCELRGIRDSNNFFLISTNVTFSATLCSLWWWYTDLIFKSFFLGHRNNKCNLFQYFLRFHHL